MHTIEQITAQLDEVFASPQDSGDIFQKIETIKQGLTELEQINGSVLQNVAQLIAKYEIQLLGLINDAMSKIDLNTVENNEKFDKLTKEKENLLNQIDNKSQLPKIIKDMSRIVRAHLLHSLHGNNANDELYAALLIYGTALKENLSKSKYESVENIFNDQSIVNSLEYKAIENSIKGESNHSVKHFYMTGGQNQSTFDEIMDILNKYTIEAIYFENISHFIKAIIAVNAILKTQSVGLPAMEEILSLRDENGYPIFVQDHELSIESVTHEELMPHVIENTSLNRRARIAAAPEGFTCGGVTLTGYEVYDARDPRFDGMDWEDKSRLPALRVKQVKDLRAVMIVFALFGLANLIYRSSLECESFTAMKPGSVAATVNSIRGSLPQLKSENKSELKELLNEACNSEYEMINSSKSDYVKQKMDALSDHMTILESADIRHLTTLARYSISLEGTQDRVKLRIEGTQDRVKLRIKSYLAKNLLLDMYRFAFNGLFINPEFSHFDYKRIENNLNAIKDAKEFIIDEPDHPAVKALLRLGAVEPVKQAANNGQIDASVEQGRPDGAGEVSASTSNAVFKTSADFYKALNALHSKKDESLGLQSAGGSEQGGSSNSPKSASQCPQVSKIAILRLIAMDKSKFWTAWHVIKEKQAKEVGHVQSPQQIYQFILSQYTLKNPVMEDFFVDKGGLDIVSGKKRSKIFWDNLCSFGERYFKKISIVATHIGDMPQRFLLWIQYKAFGVRKQVAERAHMQAWNIFMEWNQAKRLLQKFAFPMIFGSIMPLVFGISFYQAYTASTVSSWMLQIGVTWLALVANAFYFGMLVRNDDCGVVSNMREDGDVGSSAIANSQVFSGVTNHKSWLTQVWPVCGFALSVVMLALVWHANTAQWWSINVVWLNIATSLCFVLSGLGFAGFLMQFFPIVSLPLSKHLPTISTQISPIAQQIQATINASASFSFWLLGIFSWAILSFASILTQSILLLYELLLSTEEGFCIFLVVLAFYMLKITSILGALFK